ncbi:MAG: 30S ribosomal protein S16 [Cytophagales bacterium]|nr:MAG: 30S ribosomal protein S16 [Cytophagales bacterium]
MAVKIRLTRRGRKKLALYDIVVADARSSRDGKFIEKLGTFNPNKNPVIITLDDDKALNWVLTGAQPTDTARKLLSIRGVMMRKHLQVGVNKGAITQEVADKRFAEWLESKEQSIAKEIASLSDKKSVARKEKLAAEAKVNAARQDALTAKNNAALAALAEAEAAANVEVEAVAPATTTEESSAAE